MQLAMKPYVTVGVALVGASVIAVAPIAPRAEMHTPAVNLTASIDNPITVFQPVVNAAGDLIRETLENEFANPFPILAQVLANQRYTIDQVLKAINAGGAAIGDLVQGLPAALDAAGAILRTGNINGAIDSLVASGLQPVLDFILGVTTPLQAALERPFAVGQALVGAAFESGLAITVALAQTFIGIGFQVGTTPIVQNLISVTESVLKSFTTLNPINVINAVQNGIADVLLNVVNHIDDFNTQTVSYIRTVIVNALKAGQPATANKVAASVATAPDVDAPTVTITLPGAENTGGSPVISPVSSTGDEAAQETPAEEPAAEEPSLDQPVAEEPVTVEPVAEEPAAEESIDTETDADKDVSDEDDAGKDDAGEDDAGEGESANDDADTKPVKADDKKSDSNDSDSGKDNSGSSDSSAAA